MDVEQFQEVLIGVVTEGQIAEAEGIIQNLIDSKYDLYLQLLMNSIQQIDKPKIFNVSVTLMCREVKSKRIFADQDLALEVIQDLTPLVANILQSPKVEDNFKKIMAYVLAHLHIFIYRSISNTDIPTYLLTIYNQMPEIRKYLVFCISEISFNDEEYGGFGIEDLCTVVTDNINDEATYIPKLNLFFSIAMRNIDNEDLHKIFPDLFSACPQSQIMDMLKAFSNFAEHSSIFFQPFLEPLVQRFCEIAQDTDNDIKLRNSAMNCLTSMAEGATELYQSSEEYYAPVFKTLIQVAAEINDDSPWEYDANNDEPYQIALDSIAILFEKFQNVDIFIPIIEMAINVLQQDDVPWQTAYASISALAEINMITMNTIFESSKEEVQKMLFEKLATFLDIECNPRTRIAVYNFIWKLSQHGVIFPLVTEKNKYTQILIEPLEVVMILEDNRIAKKIAYQAYAQFISQSTSQKTNLYCERFYPQLEKELQTLEDNDFKIYIVRLIGPIVKLARDDSIKYFQNIFQISVALMRDKDPNVRAEAVRCFALASAYIPKKRDNNVTQFCARFLVGGIKTLEFETALNEESLEHLYEAIHYLIKAIGHYVAPIVPHIIQKVLEDSNKPISVEQADSLDDNDVFNNRSLYIRISPKNSHIKQFVRKFEVAEVEHSLMILEALIHSDPNFRQYIDEIYNINDNWLANEYPIEPLQIKCWTILDALNEIFMYNFNNADDDSNLDEIKVESLKQIQTVFRCYICNIDKRSSPILMSIMLKVTSDAISFASKLKWIADESFEKILQTILPLLNDLFVMKEKKIKEMEEYATIDLSDKMISHLDSCLNFVTELISSCFELQPEITNEFYNGTIGTKIDEYLESDVTKIFGVTITCSYIIYTKDLEKMLSFCEILMSYALLFDRPDDLQLAALSSLGKLLYEFPIGNKENADLFLTFFNQFFQTEQIEKSDEASIMISDYANVAFAKFILMNYKHFKPSDIANDFLDAAPLWDDSEDCDYYFQCIELMLDNGWFWLKDVCGNDWPEFVLGQIITGFLTNQFEESTRIKFAKTFTRLLETEEQKEAIAKTLENSIECKRASQFNKLLYIPPERSQ